MVTLAQNLELENQALLRRDAALLPAVDHGDRLDEMQARLADAAATARPRSSTTTSTRSTCGSSCRSARRPACSLGLDGRGDGRPRRPTTPTGHLLSGARRRSPRRSPCAARPATAGSTWACSRSGATANTRLRFG